MTQQELADRAKATQQTIIALEANRYAPSLPLAFRIARVFGVTIEDACQYDDDAIVCGELSSMMLRLV